MAPGSIVVLHACCHNPTGADLTQEQWGQVIDAVQHGGLIPFLDMAYQGFGAGIAEDGAVVARFVEAGGPLLVSNSFSKSFSLYGERVGALSVVASSRRRSGAPAVAAQARRAHQLLEPATCMAARWWRRSCRRRNCASCGKKSWPACACASSRCASALVQKLAEKAPGRDFAFVREQVGMFSYSGLTKEQVGKLREESIYAVDTGRICVAALNSKNIDLVVDAIAKVL